MYIPVISYEDLEENQSCLPSWFRQERSAPEGLQQDHSSTESPESSSSSLKTVFETNEIGEPDEEKKDSEDVTSSEDPIPTPGEFLTTSEGREGVEEKKKNELEDVVKDLASKEAQYEYEYEEEKEEEEAGEALKYNEKATKEATATLKPSVRKEIEKLKEAKCKDYCHHNATCHVEVIFRDARVSAVVPSCHCPHGWEGTRCDRHYVQAAYAPVSGRYNVRLSTTASLSVQQGSSSAVPAFAFLFAMLIMFMAIVIYAYRRMSKRPDDQTYTMSNMCPPEAFTVLKTPNGRPIPILTDPMSGQSTSSAQQQRIPMRHQAVRSVDSARNNFFSILRSQGAIPARNINDDDTPKHYKSVPRVEVSAINYSGHIDFSTVSFQSTESEVSKAAATCPPPAHVVIEMEEQNFRSPSRSAGEPGSPTTCEPMIPPKLP